MPQQMPVIRQMYWTGSIPQVLAIGALAFAFHAVFRNLDAPQSLFAGAVFYMIFCRAMRLIFAQEHRRGMAAYRARNFHDAIPPFEASYRFFSEHRQIFRP